MTNPIFALADLTFDNLSFVAGTDGQPGKVIGHSGDFNIAISYTGPVPIMPADLASAIKSIPPQQQPDLTPVIQAIPKPIDNSAAITAMQVSLASVLAAVTKLATAQAAPVGPSEFTVSVDPASNGLLLKMLDPSTK